MLLARERAVKAIAADKAMLHDCVSLDNEPGWRRQKRTSPAGCVSRWM